MAWNDFLTGAKELPFWAFSIRAVILYTFLIFATRMMQQRQIAILSGHNYLVAAGIVSLAAVRMVNPETSLLSGIVIILVYAAANIFISFLDIKFPRKVDRHATILIEDGKLNRKNMMDARITIDNLMGQLRLKNVFNLSEVAAALVEPTGKINVVKKAQGLPVTRKQMKLPPKYVMVPVILIYDGKVQNKNLTMMGYTPGWLDAKIREQGATQAKDVFLAVLDGNGAIHLSV